MQISNTLFNQPNNYEWLYSIQIIITKALSLYLHSCNHRVPTHPIPALRHVCLQIVYTCLKAYIWAGRRQGPLREISLGCRQPERCCGCHGVSLSLLTLVRGVLQCCCPSPDTFSYPTPALSLADCKNGCLLFAGLCVTLNLLCCVCICPMIYCMFSFWIC